MIEIQYRPGQEPSLEVQEAMALALKLAANCTHGDMGWQVDSTPWIKSCPIFAAYVGELDDVHDVDCTSLIEEVSSDLTLMIDYLRYARFPPKDTSKGKRRLTKNGYTIHFNENVSYNSNGTVRSNVLIFRLCGGNWFIYYRLGHFKFYDDELGTKMSVEYEKVTDVVFEGSEEDFLHDMFMYRLMI
jgi:hypothetical protein